MHIHIEFTGRQFISAGTPANTKQHNFVAGKVEWFQDNGADREVFSTNASGLHIYGVTQQNAALVEEASAASKAMQQESEKDGKIVEQVERVFLKPTDFSKLK